VSVRLLQTFRRLAAQIEQPGVREALAQQMEAVWESASAATLDRLRCRRDSGIFT
jgi:hypothetical protein